MKKVIHDTPADRRVPTAGPTSPDGIIAGRHSAGHRFPTDVAAIDNRFIITASRHERSPAIAVTVGGFKVTGFFRMADCLTDLFLRRDNK